jgi:hypothetical protein
MMIRCLKDLEHYMLKKEAIEIWFKLATKYQLVIIYVSTSIDRHIYTITLGIEYYLSKYLRRLQDILLARFISAGQNIVFLLRFGMIR